MTRHPVSSKADLKGSAFDRFRALQLGVEGEGGNFDFMHEFFETAYAGELDRLADNAVRPKRAFRHAQIDAVFHRAGAAHSF